MPGPIRAVLFDKDGTLTDFRATWEGWVAALVRDLALEAGVPAAALRAALGLDDAGRLRADALFVTAPFPVTLAALAEAAAHEPARLRRWLRARPGPARQVPVGEPARLLAALRSTGLSLGVLTNADRVSAREDLEAMGAWPHLDALVAADDGHGAKPEPAGALHFAAQAGLDPAEVLLVGDGLADLQAARGAGMPFAGVLTGTRGPHEFPGAAAVLADVHALPDWLAGRP
ncbi:HAD family hydrolase [Jannaschia sp. W003]|uniref:HAD family hydrolase n=1 Tax=Jannaschia sp. W003 TaxID=2867012 RepID=UPI0021A8AE40|nr:HAD family hydrolase [Jannaschia sp. W003]UWQ21041.1 HAD family hydrolase [Jannaschia sp. W003]